MATRVGYVSEFELELADGADRRDPGGAVTLELCGAFEHVPPCEWPHLTTIDGDDPALVRVLFVADEEAEDAVRARIAGALGGSSTWRVVRTLGARPLRADDEAWAASNAAAS